MDMRYTNDILRAEIEKADLSDFGEYLSKDIKRRANAHIDAIEEYQIQIEELKGKIKAERNALKQLANEWEF